MHAGNGKIFWATPAKAQRNPTTLRATGFTQDKGPCQRSTKGPWAQLSVGAPHHFAGSQGQLEKDSKTQKAAKATRNYKNVLVSMEGESVGLITAETKQLYISIETRAMSIAD